MKKNAIIVLILLKATVKKNNRYQFIPNNIYQLLLRIDNVSGCSVHKLIAIVLNFEVATPLLKQNLFELIGSKLFLPPKKIKVHSEVVHIFL